MWRGSAATEHLRRYLENLGIDVTARQIESWTTRRLVSASSPPELWAELADVSARKEPLAS